MVSSITVSWLLIVVIVGNIERQHLARTVVAAMDLKLGQAETEISALLGNPLAEYSAYDGWSFLAIGKHPRQWCYGTIINLDNIFVTESIVTVNPLPFNIRWFGYCDSNLVIDWNANDRVERIEVPQARFAIDNRFDGVLEMCYTLRAIGQAMCEAPPIK